MFSPLPGTFITKFVRENPSADDLMMFDFADRADKCLRRPCRFALPGSDKLVTELSTYTSGILYCSLTAFYIDMELLTSDSMLLPIIAASGFTYLCVKVRPAPYFRWLQLHHRGGLTGVCVASVSQPAVHWMKRTPFGSIRIESHRAVVFVEP